MKTLPSELIKVPKRPTNTTNNTFRYCDHVTPTVKVFKIFVRKI